MKESGKLIKEKEMEYLALVIEIYVKEILKMIIQKEKEYIIVIMEIELKEIKM